MSAGTVFVELDLSFDKFEKNQQKLIQSATSASLSIEKNFQNIGVKSDAIYEAMRRSATNSLEMIVAKSTSTGNEIERAQKATADKIKSINEEQFGKHTSLIDSLKQNWVAASAAIVGAWMLVNKAVGYMDLGAKAFQVETAFRLMADSSHINADELIKNMDRAARGTIDDSALMQRALFAMSMNVPADKLPAIFEAARIAAIRTGRDVGEVAEVMITAIGSEVPRSLKKMGAITKEQMDLFTEYVTAGGKAIHLYDLVIAKGAQDTIAFGDANKSAAEQLQTFKKEVNEIKENIGKGLIVSMEGLYKSLELTAAAAMYLGSVFPQIVSGIESVRAANAWLAGDKERYEGLTKSAKSYWQTSIDMQGAAAVLYDKVAASHDESVVAAVKASNTQTMAAKEREVSLNAEMKAYVEAQGAKKSALETLKAADKSYFQEQEILLKSSTELMKANYATDFDIAKSTIDQKSAIITEFYTRSKAEIKAEARARTKEERDKLSDSALVANKMIALNADVNKQRLEANANFTNAEIQIEGKWLAKKRDLNQTSLQIAMRELDREYASFDKITRDKNSLDEWYAAKKRQIDLELANEGIAIYKALYEDAVKKESWRAKEYLRIGRQLNDQILGDDKAKWREILGNSDDAVRYMKIKDEQFVNDFTSANRQMVAASNLWAAETVKATDSVAIGMNNSQNAAASFTDSMVVGMNNSQKAVASLSASLVDAQSHLSGFPINLGATTGTPAVSAPTGAYTGAGAPIVGVSGGVTITTISGLSVQQYNAQQAAAAAVTAAANELYALQQAAAAAAAAAKAASVISTKRVIDKVYTIGQIQGYFIWSDGTLSPFTDGGMKYPNPITIQGATPQLTVVAKAVTQKGYSAPPGSWFADTPDKGQIAFSDGSVKNYASGGWITEPVRGVGRSGKKYELGESGPEMVTPAGKMMGGSTTNVFRIYLDGEEIKGRIRVVADKVIVDRNKSGINSTMRVYQ